MSAARRLAAPAATAAALLFLAAMAWDRRWLCDDAFIDLRVARHLLAGHGPVYNLGERVEVYSNPLWVAALALWGALGGALDAGALWLGLVAFLAGIVLALVACARRRSADSGPFLPAGLLVLAALPPVWDFATSGLETGFVSLWLGACLLALAGDRPHRPGTAVLLGLGPLVRPDLAVFSLAFLAAALRPWPGPGRSARAAAAWAALPIVYQVFRMGWFAALVASPALAKDAAGARWERGLAYLADAVEPYALLVPLAGLAWLAVPALRGPGATPIAASLAASALDALWVVRVGGDFMHARLLLPALLGVALPLAAVRPAGDGRRAFALAAIAAWSIACAATMRVRHPPGGTASGVVDERAWYAGGAGVRNPDSAAAHAGMHTARDGANLARLAAGLAPGTAAVRVGDGPAPGLGPDPPSVRLLEATPRAGGAVRLVALRGTLGLVGWFAGDAVHVVDRHGLGDPVAARLPPHPELRAGHQKVLGEAWVAARFSNLPAGGDRELAAAKAALGCGDLAQLIAAVEQPMTSARFARNLALAWRLTRLRIPEEPGQAARRFCPAEPAR